MKVNPKIAVAVGIGFVSFVAAIIFLITGYFSKSETPRDNKNASGSKLDKSEDSEYTTIGNGVENPTSSLLRTEGVGLEHSPKEQKEQVTKPPQIVNEPDNQENQKTTIEVSSIQKLENKTNVLQSPKEKTTKSETTIASASSKKGENNIYSMSSKPEMQPPKPNNELNSQQLNTASIITKSEGHTQNLVKPLQVDAERKRKYEGLFWEYMANPDHELRNDLQFAHDDSYKVGGVNFNKTYVDLHDLILNKFGKSPWKPVFTFLNNKIPDEALLDKMDKLSLEEAQELPFEPFLKQVLSIEGLKKMYVAVCRKVHYYQSHPKELPLTVDFANHHLVLPYSAKKIVESILDVNWDKRATSLYANNDKRVKDLGIPHGIIVDEEVNYAINMFRRRSAQPKSHITKAELDDVYSAFKKFNRPDLGLGQKLDVSSLAAFLFSILDRLLADWEAERESKNFKDTRANHMNDQRAQRLHSTLKNFLNLIPELEKDALVMKFETLFKTKADRFLDSSLACAQKEFQTTQTEQEQRNVLKKVYDEYVAYAKYYGVTPIECDDPLKLLSRIGN